MAASLKSSEETKNRKRKMYFIFCLCCHHCCLYWSDCLLVIGIMVYLGNKVSQQQLIQNNELNEMKLNDTIQSYTKKEIEKLGKSIDKKLDPEIREIAQLIKGIRKKLNSTSKDLQASSLLPSCAAILQQNPFSVSGYYCIYSSSHKASLRVYCDMSKTCGDSDT